MENAALETANLELKKVILSENLQLLKEKLAGNEIALRKHRKYLLIAGGVSYLADRINLIPTRIEALGIELNSVEQDNFRVILVALSTYFLFLFLRDISSERVHFIHYFSYDLELALAREESKVHRAAASTGKDLVGNARRWFVVSNWMTRLMDYWLPIVLYLLGLLACLRLLPNWSPFI